MKDMTKFCVGSDILFEQCQEEQNTVPKKVIFSFFPFYFVCGGTALVGCCKVVFVFRDAVHSHQFV